MSDEPFDADTFIAEFREQLSRSDEVVHVILNSHLEVEKHLDEVLSAIFFHPEHLQEGRLAFYQKVQMARAYAPEESRHIEWRLLQALNALRNEIAHGKKSERRGAKIAELGRLVIEWGPSDFEKRVNAADESEVVVLTAAACSGFLIVLEERIREVREIIDEGRRQGDRDARQTANRKSRKPQVDSTSSE